MPNFVRIDAMNDEKDRTIYFKSVSSGGTKGMRLHYLRDQEAAFITSQLIDGGYRADAETVDIIWKQKKGNSYLKLKAEAFDIAIQIL